MHKAFGLDGPDVPEQVTVCVFCEPGAINLLELEGYEVVGFECEDCEYFRVFEQNMIEWESVTYDDVPF